MMLPLSVSIFASAVAQLPFPIMPNIAFIVEICPKSNTLIVQIKILVLWKFVKADSEHKANL